MMLLLNPQGRIAGLAHETYDPGEGWQKLLLPDGFADEDWDFLVVTDGVVTVDAVARAAQDLADAKSSLKQQATALRWERETGGITLPGGVRVGTSIEDQNRITSVIANAQLAGVSTVDFKAATGWATLTLAEVQAIAAAIAAHVQACFSAERVHHEAIDALADLAAVQAYDITAGWPAANPHE